MEYLTIDNDTRTITIPSSITVLGVESDEDVNRLYFKMPCVYGEWDLTQFTIRINFMNANGDSDVYDVTDMESDGENMTFSWLVGRAATAYKGKTSFIVCLKLTDENDNLVQEFNTKLTKLKVLEGLEYSSSGSYTDADEVSY